MLQVNGQFLVGVPGAIDDLEAELPEIPEELEIAPDIPGDRQSLGTMLENRGKTAEAESHLGAYDKARMKGVDEGRIIAYKTETPHRCRLGKVLAVTEDRKSVTVQPYKAHWKGFKIQWEPQIDELNQDAGGTFSSQVKETISHRDVLQLVVLSQKGELNYDNYLVQGT